MSGSVTGRATSRCSSSPNDSPDALTPACTSHGAVRRAGHQPSGQLILTACFGNRLELLVAGHRGGSRSLELRRCTHLVEERITIDRRIRTMIPFDGERQEANCRIGLSAVGEMGGKEIIHLRI